MLFLCEWDQYAVWKYVWVKAKSQYDNHNYFEIADNKNLVH